LAKNDQIEHGTYKIDGTNDGEKCRTKCNKYNATDKEKPNSKLG
jgi:hypothetical protein